MTKRTRRNHGAAFKAKVALEAVKGEQIPVELAQRFQVYTNKITEWKKEPLDRASEIFGKNGKPREPDVKKFHTRMGQRAMENDFFISRARAHGLYLYPLRGLTITEENHVCCADKSSILMAKGFCYLTAIME